MERVLFEGLIELFGFEVVPRIGRLFLKLILVSSISIRLISFLKGWLERNHVLSLDLTLWSTLLKSRYLNVPIAFLA